MHFYDFDIVWREFVWGAIAGAFGEGMMHPIDTIKTRIQSQALLSGSQVWWRSIMEPGFTVLEGISYIQSLCGAVGGD